MLLILKIIGAHLLLPGLLCLLFSLGMEVLSLALPPPGKHNESLRRQAASSFVKRLRHSPSSFVIRQAASSFVKQLRHSPRSFIIRQAASSFSKQLHHSSSSFLIHQAASSFVKQLHHSSSSFVIHQAPLLMAIRNKLAHPST